jgi:uncharacterized coiled-coil protein SlyX
MNGTKKELKERLAAQEKVLREMEESLAAAKRLIEETRAILDAAEDDEPKKGSGRRK